MKHPIMIIGSGFAAYQLVKTLRRTDQEIEIVVVTSDDGHDYNKPDISHVFSKKQDANALIRQTAQSFAQEQRIKIYTHTRVEMIDPLSQAVTTMDGQKLPYSKLVLATGASTFIPIVTGSAIDKIITLNSRVEYQHSQQVIHQSEHILIIGAGLIGTELAMDLSTSGKSISLVDPCASVMEAMLPDSVSAPLEKQLVKGGTKLYLNNYVQHLLETECGIEVVLDSGDQFMVDSVVCAAGLKPNIQLAKQAGLKVEKGIVVNRQLQTSQPNIYAIGDCAQIETKVFSYLQPTLLSANVLAKSLLQLESVDLKLPSMLIKVKTPNYPVQLSGNTGKDVHHWSIKVDPEGLTAQAFNAEDALIGFVVTQDHMKHAFPMLRQLPASV